MVPNSVKRNSKPISKIVRNYQVNVRVNVSSDESIPTMATDESYTLSIESQPTAASVAIVAKSFFGARHALETLSQLIAWDETASSYLLISEAQIADSPAFLHRGLLLDTSRNYVSVAALKRILDAMSYDKLNVLHWVFEAANFNIGFISMHLILIFNDI